MRDVNFGILVGKTLKRVENIGNKTIVFETIDGERYEMLHEQDCCESVSVEDICGDLEDLIGSPVIRASEDSNSDNPRSGDDESFTWTFYNIATAKGHVTIRWYGTSNGYYSERVDFAKVN